MSLIFGPPPISLWPLAAWRELKLASTVLESAAGRLRAAQHHPPCLGVKAK